MPTPVPVAVVDLATLVADDLDAVDLVAVLVDLLATEAADAWLFVPEDTAELRLLPLVIDLA